MRQYQNRKISKQPIKSPDPDLARKSLITTTKFPLEQIKLYLKNQLSKSIFSTSAKDQNLEKVSNDHFFEESTKKFIIEFGQHSESLKLFEDISNKYRLSVEQNHKLKSEMEGLKIELQNCINNLQSFRLTPRESRVSNQENESYILKQFNSRMTRLVEQNKKLVKRSQDLNILEGKNEYLRKDNELLKNQIIYLNEYINAKGSESSRRQKQTEKINNILQSVQKEFLTYSKNFEEKIKNKLKQIQQKITIFKSIEDQLKFQSLKMKNRKEKYQSNIQKNSNELKIQNQKLTYKVKFLECQIAKLTERCLNLHTTAEQYKKDSILSLFVPLDEKKIESEEQIFLQKKLKIIEQQLEEAKNKIETTNQNFEHEINQFLRAIQQQKTKSQYYQKSIKQLKQKISDLTDLAEKDDGLRSMRSSNLSNFGQNDARNFNHAQRQDSVQEQHLNTVIIQFVDLLQKIKSDLEDADLNSILIQFDSFETQKKMLESTFDQLKKQYLTIIQEISKKNMEQENLLIKIQLENRLKEIRIKQLQEQLKQPKTCNNVLNNNNKILIVESFQPNKMEDRSFKAKQKLKKTFNQLHTFEKKIIEHLRK